AVLRRTAGPVISAWSYTPRLPWPYGLADHAGRVLVDPPGTHRQRVDFASCSGALVTPASPGRQVGVYLHGGALLVGGRHLHRSLVARIAGGSRMRMVVPSYRQLPHHSVDASIADALDAYTFALTLVDDPGDVILLGDSAGGFLSFMVAIAARDSGLPMPGGIVAMSPLIELDHRDRGIDKRPAGETIFTPRALRAFTNAVRRMQEKSGGEWPFTGPAQADLAELPPTLIQTSSAEILHHEAMTMGALLAASGVEVEVQVWDGQAHVFQAAAGVLPEAAQALAQIAVFTGRVGSAAGI
ncbi:MAG TPA: alpha/beta hydrolase fold domain-containing protein, partial [Marmoricola sp.]|nr:alpha/beta hydrolase fold domain-containing protein [Marmoricola sp.]